MKLVHCQNNFLCCNFYYTYMSLCSDDGFNLLAFINGHKYVSPSYYKNNHNHLSSTVMETIWVHLDLMNLISVLRMSHGTRD